MEVGKLAMPAKPSRAACATSAARSARGSKADAPNTTGMLTLSRISAMAKVRTTSFASWIGSMQAMEGAPMTRTRPAFRASRKSAPPRSAALAIMPVPMAAPMRKGLPSDFPSCPFSQPAAPGAAADEGRAAGAGTMATLQMRDRLELKPRLPTRVASPFAGAQEQCRGLFLVLAGLLERGDDQPADAFEVRRVDGLEVAGCERHRLNDLEYHPNFCVQFLKKINKILNS